MIALRALIDWPLTGAPRTVPPLLGLDERERVEWLAEVLTRLDDSASRPDDVERLLMQACELLLDAREIRVADPAYQEWALGLLRVPVEPPGLTGDLVARLAGLRERAAALSEVYVVAGSGRKMPVVWAADTGRLVLVIE